MFEMTFDLLESIAASSSLIIKVFDEIFMAFYQGKTPPRPSIKKLYFIRQCNTPRLFLSWIACAKYLQKVENWTSRTWRLPSGWYKVCFWKSKHILQYTLLSISTIDRWGTCFKVMIKFFILKRPKISKNQSNLT